MKKGAHGMNVALTPRAIADLRRIRLVSGETIAERATKQDIGSKSEALVAKGLDFLKSLGMIYGYHRSKHKGELDSKLKIDFLVMPLGEENRLIGLQVKSSIIEQERHKKKSRIPCVAVRSFHFHVSIQILAEELLRVMGLSLDDQDIREDETIEEEDEEGLMGQLFDQLGFNYYYDLEP